LRQYSDITLGGRYIGLPAEEETRSEEEDIVPPYVFLLAGRAYMENEKLYGLEEWRRKRFFSYMELARRRQLLFFCALISRLAAYRSYFSVHIYL